MTSRYLVREAAIDLAQDSSPGTDATGVQLLLNYPGDYNLAITNALRIFRRDVPNIRVVDQVLAASGFRLVLYGSGALSGLTGTDAWVPGVSVITALWYPWRATVQDLRPLDSETYRVVRDPGDKWVLELLDRTAQAADTLRLQFTSQYALTESPDAVTDPAAAPTAALASPAAPGNVDNGTHTYTFAWVTAQGYTLPSPASAVVTVADRTVNGQVAVVVPAAEADQGVTAARIYRTVAGDTGTRKLVGTLTATDGGGTFTDNVADASLGADVPAENTAHGANTVSTADGEALAMLTASLVLELAAVKAVQNTGNSGLPNDIVDRRSQAMEFSSRAKRLREIYGSLIGRSTKAEVDPASGYRDLDVQSASGMGFIWHPTNRR